ncbi:unnamed protein product [Closterium sp. NIES-53]
MGSLPFYHLFPYRSAPLPPLPLFLAPGPPPVDPLPPQGPAPSGVSQVDPLPGAVPVEVTVDSGAARGTASGSATSGGVEPASAEPGGAEPAGAEREGAEPGGAEPEGAEPGGPDLEVAEPGGAESEDAGSEGAEPRLREWFAQRTRLRSGDAGAGESAAGGTGAGGVGATSLGGARVTAGAGGTGGAAAADPGVPRTRGTGAAGAGGIGGVGAGGARAGDLGAGRAGAGGSVAGGAGRAGAEGSIAGGAGDGEAGAGDPGAGGTGAGGTGPGDTCGGGAGDRGAGAGDPGARGTGAGGTGAGGAGAGGTRVVDPGAGGAGGGGAASGGISAGGTVQRCPFFILSLPSSLSPPDSVLLEVLSLTSSTDLPPSLQSPPPCQSQPQSQPDSPLPAPSPYTKQTDSLTEHRELESRPVMTVRAVRTGHQVPRPRPPPVPDTHIMTLRPSSIPLRVPLPPPPESSLPAVPDPDSDQARAANPAVSRLLAFRVTDPSFDSSAPFALVTELVDFAAACHLDYATSLVAESESDCPLSVGCECALGTDVLEDRQEDFECLAATVPHLVAMLLAREGDSDAPDIPTPRSYAEAITGPYSSQWQTAMDAEMASRKSTGSYVDALPPSWANIVDGMWIFRVKRPPGSSTVFKDRYVARGFSHRQGVEFFQTFSSTPKMTTLWVLLYDAAQRDYELHSLEISTTFLQGSLHEEIWLRRPSGFTVSFPAGTQWSLRRPIYGLRQAPREWHDTLRMMLATLGFAPSTADLSQFLRTDTSLPPFYILVYVDDLIFATTDIETLALVKSKLQKRHTCIDLGELLSYLGLQITRDIARRTIALTQSHMVHQVLQRFGFRSSPQSTPLPTGHSLSAPPLDESVEPSGPYPELVGCLITLGMGLVLGGRGPVVFTGHADASWVDDLATLRSSHGYIFSLGSGSFSWRSSRSSSVLSSSCEAKIYARAMAAEELRWLTYLLTD